MSGRRSSRRRTSRRIVPNERQWTTYISPLDYADAGVPPGALSRMALVETEAPLPKSGSSYRYFVPQFEIFQRRVRYPKGHPQQGEWKPSTKLKKPKLVVPGAPENTVAFIDYEINDGKYLNAFFRPTPRYSEHGPKENRHVYIWYMAVRPDMREQRLGADLLDRFMLAAQAGGAVSVDFGKVMSDRVWKMMRRWAKAHEDGTYVPTVQGKNYSSR